MDMRIELYRELSTKQLMLFNCSVWKRLFSLLGRRIKSEFSLEGLMLKLKPNIWTT